MVIDFTLRFVSQNIIVLHCLAAQWPYYVDCIHGDKEQYSRESVLSAFRQGRIVILDSY